MLKFVLLKVAPTLIPPLLTQSIVERSIKSKAALASHGTPFVLPPSRMTFLVVTPPPRVTLLLISVLLALKLGPSHLTPTFLAPVPSPLTLLSPRFKTSRMSSVPGGTSIPVVITLFVNVIYNIFEMVAPTTPFTTPSLPPPRVTIANLPLPGHMIWPTVASRSVLIFPSDATPLHKL